MEITQIIIPVCQARLHVHVFQAGKEEWPVKSGHWGKGKLGFKLFSFFFFSPLSLLHVPLYLILCLVSEHFMKQITLVKQKMTAREHQTNACGFTR